MKVRYVYLKRLYINVLIILILFSASTIISPMMSAQLVDGVVRTVDDWLWLLILFIISYMIQILLSTLDYWQKGWFSAKEKRIMRQEIFQAALKKGRISRKENANIVSFVNNHVASIVQSIYIGEIGIVQCFSLILFSVLALIYLHWLFAMIILVISLLIIVVPGALQRKAQAANLSYTAALSSFNLQLISFLGGLSVIMQNSFSFGAARRIKYINSDIETHEEKMIALRTFVESTSGALHLVQDVFVITMGVFLVSKQMASIGDLLAALQISNIVSAPMEAIAYMVHDMNEKKPLLEQFKVLSNGNEQPIIIEKQHLSDSEKFTSLCVSQLSFQADKQMIFSGVNFCLEKGGKYLIRGDSGCGKSVLMQMMVNEINPSAGNIRLNQKGTVKSSSQLWTPFTMSRCLFIQ